jgi:hypothetical protein
MSGVTTDTYCANCGQPIYNEDSHNRKPCPNCGATSRNYSLTAHITVAVSGAVNVTKVSYPQSLLNSAGNLISKGDELSLSMAVVLCHTACDIAADRALSAALEGRQLGHVKKPLRAMFTGYSPKNDRFWDLFSALTGQKIKKQPFWNAVKESCKYRDSIVHKGKLAACVSNPG